VRHEIVRPRLKRPRLLERDFFARDPRAVAPELLGKLLVRHDEGKLLTGRIVETEAYLGKNDLAAHATAGRTARNSVLFGPPGHAYVYFIYGNHYCLNVSCMPQGEAGCVLIRALEPLSGAELMARRRGLKTNVISGNGRRLLTSGPGRLCEAFTITRTRDNGKDLVDPDSDLVLMDDSRHPEQITVTPRVGITKAAEYPLRYVIAGNRFVTGSRARLLTPQCGSVP
jgi:DNA-3-methyladenine glycosylase